MTDLDAAHARPAGASDEAVRAAGAFTEAVERLERARGALYEFHQLVGGADAQLDEALELLRKAGHGALAEEVADELVGRNVLAGRWTFQLVEEFDDGYHAVFKRYEQRVRDALTDGRRHVLEAELKQRRRTPGHPDHTATPGGTG